MDSHSENSTLLSMIELLQSASLKEKIITLLTELLKKNASQNNSPLIPLFIKLADRELSVFINSLRQVAGVSQANIPQTVSQRALDMLVSASLSLNEASENKNLEDSIIQCFVKLFLFMQYINDNKSGQKKTERQILNNLMHLISYGAVGECIFQNPNILELLMEDSTITAKPKSSNDTSTYDRNVILHQVIDPQLFMPAPDEESVIALNSNFDSLIESIRNLLVMQESNEKRIEGAIENLKTILNSEDFLGKIDQATDEVCGLILNLFNFLPYNLFSQIIPEFILCFSNKEIFLKKALETAENKYKCEENNEIKEKILENLMKIAINLFKEEDERYLSVLNIVSNIINFNPLNLSNIADFFITHNTPELAEKLYLSKIGAKESQNNSDTVIQFVYSLLLSGGTNGTYAGIIELDSPLDNEKDAMMHANHCCMRRLLQAYYLIQEIPDSYQNIVEIKNRLHQMLSGNFSAESRPNASMATWLPGLRDYYQAYRAYRNEPEKQNTRELAEVVRAIKRSEQEVIQYFPKTEESSKQAAVTDPRLFAQGSSPSPQSKKQKPSPSGPSSP